MIGKEQVAVIVPTYKEYLNESEKISLEQVLRVLRDYDIYFMAPDKLRADYLTKARIERFPNVYFESISEYNRLMLSVDFYNRFISYQYVLMYQLDAFVFSDKLMYFCNLGFDYIGAPWLTGFRQKCNEGYVYANVGNGGFSLRNINSTIKLLRDKKKELAQYEDNEDKFFAFSNGNSFHVAPISIALEFAFEREVERCFELNHFNLPFGCHAWKRYNYNFWKSYINAEGYMLPIKESDVEMEDEINSEVYKQNELIQKFWIYDDKISLANVDNKKIAIFGTGMYGKRVLTILEHSSISVECFIDNNKAMQNICIKEYPIYPPKILDMNRNYLIIIAITGNGMGEVREQLDKMGKLYKQDYVTYLDLIS